MDSILAVPAYLQLILLVVMVVLKGWALVDAFTHSADAYVAGDKLTKNAWLIILGITFVAQIAWLDPINLINLAGVVAAIVYLVDVRPTLRALTGKR